MAPARPPSRGWAKATVGVSNLTPLAARSTLWKERRRQHQRVDGRAHVVQEARQRQLLGAAATSRQRCTFVDFDGATSTGDRQRRRQPVGTGADHDGIEIGHRQPTVAVPSLTARVLPVKRGCPSTPGGNRASMVPEPGRSGHDGYMDTRWEPPPGGTGAPSNGLGGHDGLGAPVNGEVVQLGWYRFRCTFSRRWGRVPGPRAADRPGRRLGHGVRRRGTPDRLVLSASTGPTPTRQDLVGVPVSSTPAPG